MATLTKRQTEVLQLLATGLTTKEITNRLFITIHTLRDHLVHIRYRLAARSTANAVYIALKMGLIE